MAIRRNSGSTWSASAVPVRRHAQEALPACRDWKRLIRSIANALDRRREVTNMHIDRSLAGPSPALRDPVTRTDADTGVPSLPDQR